MWTCPAQCWMLVVWRKPSWISDSPWQCVLKCHKRCIFHCKDSTVRVCTVVHPVGPSWGSAYEIRITQMEYHVLRWTGSPSEDLSNVSNVFMESLLDLPAHGSSYCHNNHLSILMLII